MLSCQNKNQNVIAIRSRDPNVIGDCIAPKKPSQSIPIDQLG